MAEVLYKDRPVGTLEELREAGLRGNEYGSCSERTTSNNGCPWREVCKFKDHRDAVNGKRGPCNCAVLITLSPQEGSASDVREMPCHMYYYSGLHQREQQMDKTGEVIYIVAVEGDGRKFSETQSVKAHKKKDAECEACQSGQVCNKRRFEVLPEREVRPFKRLSETMPQTIAANKARVAMVKISEAQRLEAALAMQESATGGGK